MRRGHQQGFVPDFPELVEEKAWATTCLPLVNQLAVHKHEGVVEMLAELEFDQILNFNYMPDFNKIENVFTL